MPRINALQEQIKQERELVQTRVLTIQKQIEDDQATLDTYTKEFAHAIQDGANEGEIAALEDKRNAAEKRIAQNQNIIRILTNDPGTKVQRLRADLVGEHFKEMNQLEEQANAIADELQKHHEILNQGLAQLQELHVEYFRHMRSIDQTPLDRKDAEAYGIAGRRGIDRQRPIATEFPKPILLHIQQLKRFDLGVL